MKKRFLSALLALSMIFSVIPVMPAMTASADATATKVSTKDQQILEYLKFTVTEEGKIESITFKPGVSGVVSRPIGVMILSKSEYDGECNDYDDNTAEGIGTIRTWAMGTAVDDFNSVGMTQQPAVRFIIPANYMSEFKEYTYSTSTDNGMYFTSSDVNTNAAEGYTKESEDDFEVYIIISGAGSAEGSEQIYSQIIKLDKATGVGVETDPPAVSDGPEAITSVTISLTAPSNSDIGSSNSSNDASVTASDPSAALSSITPSTTWTNSTYTAGDNEVSVTLSLPDTNTYKFTSSTSAGTDWGTGTVGDGGKTITFTRKYNLEAEAATITHISAALDGPKVKTAPGDATTVKVSSDGSTYVNAATTTLTPSWTPATRANTTNFAAGVAYTAKFTVTAPSGYKFGAVGSAVTVAITAGNSVTGTATGKVTATGESGTAEVDVVYSAITKTVDSMALKSGNSVTQTSKTETDTFTVTPLALTLTYNDGTAEDVSASDYASKGIIIDTSALTNGANDGSKISSIALDSADLGVKDMVAKYVGGSGLPAATNSTNPPTAIIEELTVTHAPLGDITVSAALPAVGSATSAATDTGTPNPSTGIKYGEATLTWYTNAAATTPLSSGNFTYGGTYYVRVDLSADTDYKFDVSGTTGPNITLSDSGSSTATITNATITSTADDDENIYAIFEVKFPSITISDGGALDYYNNYATTSTDASTYVTLSDKTVTVTGVKLHGVSLAAADYSTGTFAADGKITINASALKTALGSTKETDLKTSASASGVDKWDVEVTLSNGSVTGEKLITAYNSTPYVKLTNPTSGTDKAAGTLSLTGAGSAVDNYIPLKKSTSYTVTATAATGTTHIMSYDWSASSTTDLFGIATSAVSSSSTTNSQTFTSPNSAGKYDIKADINLDSGKTLTVNAPNAQTITVKVGTGTAQTISTGGTATIYAGEQVVITATPKTHFHWNGTGDTPTDPWSLTSGTISGTATVATSTGTNAGTYTFTPDGSGNVTVTANISEDSYKTLNITKTENADTTNSITASGTVTVTASDNNTVEVTGTSGNTTSYKVYDNLTYDIAAAATSGSKTKLTTLGSETISGLTFSQTASGKSFSSETSPIAYSVVFDPLTLPDLSKDPTSTNYTAIAKDGASTGKYTGYTAGDFTLSSITLKGTALTSGTGYTLSDTNLTIEQAAVTSLEAGTHALVLNFTTTNGDTYAINRQIRVRGAGYITKAEITNSNKYVHGDTLLGTGQDGTTTHDLLIDVLDGDSNTQHYKYDGATGTWVTTTTGTIYKGEPQENITVSVTAGSGSSASTDTTIKLIDATNGFITNYATTPADMYYSTYTNSASRKHLTNGSGLVFNLSSTSDTNNTVNPTVAKKELTITLNNSTGLNRIYDTTSTAATGWSVSNVPSGEYSDSIAEANLTITGNYVNGSGNADANVAVDNDGDATTKTVKFTATPIASGETGYNVNTANYTYVIADGEGTIEKAPLNITVNKIPEITVGGTTDWQSTTTGNLTDTNTDDVYVGSGEILSTDNVKLTYYYQYTTTSSPATSTTAIDIYNTLTGSDTKIPKVDNSNYYIKSLTKSGATGKINPKDVTGIALNIPTTHYYYGTNNQGTTHHPTTYANDYSLVLIGSTGTNASVTLTYSDSTTETFVYRDNSGTNEWYNATSGVSYSMSDITLAWADTTKSGTAADAQRLSPIEHNDEKLVAQYQLNTAKPKSEVAITVDKKAIKGTATTSNSTSKVYDGDTSVDATYSYSIADTEKVLQADGTTRDDVSFIASPVTTVAYDNAAAATTRKISFTLASSPLQGNQAGNYTISIDDVTGVSITARPLRLTSLTNITHATQYLQTTANMVKTGLTASNKTTTNVAEYGKTLDTDGTTAITESGIVGSDEVTFTFDYDYSTVINNTTPTATVDSKTVVEIDGTKVTPTFKNGTTTVTLPKSLNSNYEITAVADDVSYMGYLDEVSISGIQIVLGDDDYTYITDENLTLVGTKVTVNFSASGVTPEEYQAVANGTNAIKWQKKNDSGTFVDVSSVPFKLRWNGYTSSDTIVAEGDELTHVAPNANVSAQSDGASYKGTIYAVHDSKTDGSIHGSDEVTIAKQAISKIELGWADSSGTSNKIEKTYDKTDYLLKTDRDKLKLTAYYNNGTTDVPITGNDTEVNALIKYDSAAASAYSSGTAQVDKTLVFSNIALTKDDTGKFSLPTNITVTNDPEIKGTILKRPVTLTAVRHIDSVSQNSAHTAWTSGTAASSNDAYPSGMYADFEETTGDVVTENGETTYIYLTGQSTEKRIPSDKLNITFDYQYNDTSTVKTTGNKVKGDGADYGDETVKLQNIALTSADAGNNYTLNSITEPLSVTEGTVTDVVAKEIEITTEPTQFIASTANATLQYGDKLDLSTLAVIVGYAPTLTDSVTSTKVFTYDPANETDSGDVWVDDASTPKRYKTSELPFSIAWNDTSYTINIENDTIVTPTTGVKLVATLTESGSSAASDDTAKVLKVGKRAINVTPASISKVYDGKTTLDNPTEVLTYTVAFADTSFTGLTEPTLDKNNTSVTSVTFQNNASTATKHATANGASGATKAVIAGFALTGTTNDNFAATLTTTTPSAEITARPIKLTELHFADINQFATSTATLTNLSVGTTTKPYAVLQTGVDGKGVVSGDEANLTIDATYNYTNTNTAGAISEAHSSSAGITITGNIGYTFKESGTSYEDYSLDATEYTKYGEVVEQGHTIKIEHDAHHYDGSQTSGDTLDLLGTKVTVNNDVYTAVALATPETGKVRWQKNSDTTNYITDAADLPFTLSIDTAAINAFDTSSVTLTVAGYNGKYIKATHAYTDGNGDNQSVDDIDDDTYASPNTSHALAVSPIKIIKIEPVIATDSGTGSPYAGITKYYDNTYALGTDIDGSTDNTDKLVYNLYKSDGAGGFTLITDTVALENKKPRFKTKNANTTTATELYDIDIVFGDDPDTTTAPTLASSVKEYEIAPANQFTFDISKVAGKGQIKPKKITVTNVYVPSTGKLASEPADDVITPVVTVPAANVKQSSTPSTDEIITNTALAANDTDVSFKYAIKYGKADVDEAGTYDVTLVSNAVYKADGITANGNYDVKWTMPDPFQGDVIAATLEKIELKKTSATKVAGYTHGDALDLTGLELVIYTLPFDQQGASNPVYTEEHYVVAKTGNLYKWVDGNGDDVTLPSYIQQLQIKGSGNAHDLREKTTITPDVGSPYTYYWELNNNAHYTDMNGAKITAQVAMGGVTKNATLKDGSDGTTGSDLTLGVAQKELTNATVKVTGSAYTPMSITVDPANYKDILTKYYDTTADRPAGVTITVSPDSDELQVFNTSAANNKALSTADKDTVSMKYASAAYVKDTAAKDADVEIDTPATATTSAVYGKNFVVKDIELNASDDYANYTFTKQDETLTGAILPYKLKITALPDADDAILNDTTTATKAVTDENDTTKGVTGYTANIDDESNTALKAAKPGVTYTYDYGTKINTPGTYTVAGGNGVTILDSSNDSTLALLPATDNFEIDYDNSATAVNGEVTKKKIVKIDVELPETYKYGDKLDIDDVTIKVWYDLSGTNEGTDFISNIKYADDNWKNLALKLTGTKLTAGQLPTADLTQAAGSRVTEPTDILKWVDTTTAANKMYVVVSTTDQDDPATVGTDENVSGQAEVVVNKRKILIQPEYSAIADKALVKVYDTTPYFKLNNVPTNSDNTFPLEVVTDMTGRTDSVLYNATSNPTGVKIDGLYTGDNDIDVSAIAFKLKNTTNVDANYSVLEAKTGWTGGYTGDGYPAEPMTTSYNITGTNANQYEAYMADVEGWVKPREIYLRPVVSITVPPTDTRNIDETVNWSDKDKKIKITGPNNITIFDRDKDDLSFNYKLTLPEADITAGTVTTANKYAAEATTDDGGYKHSETSAAGRSNYTFTWLPATVTMQTNAPSAIKITKPAKAHTYGDTAIDLSDVEIEVTYDDGTESGTPQKYSFADVPSNVVFKLNGVAIDSNGKLASRNMDTTPLTTGDSGTLTAEIPVGIGSTILSSNGQETKESEFTVNKKPLKLAAGSKPTRAYNGKSLVDITISVDSTTPLVEIGTNGADYKDNINFNSPKAYFYTDTTYAEKNPHVGTDKPVKFDTVSPTITNNLGVDVTDQYEIEQPDATTGTVTQKEIKVSPGDVKPIGYHPNATDDYVVDVTTSYSEPIFDEDIGTVYVELKATYTAAQVKDENNVNNAAGVTVDVSKTEYGNDTYGDYLFTLDPETATGKVIDPYINEITINTPPKTTYVHGEELDLNGMVFSIKYGSTSGNYDVSSRSNTFTYSSSTNDWTATNPVSIEGGSQVTTLTTKQLETALNMTFSLATPSNNKTHLLADDQQLRRNLYDQGFLVISGGEAEDAKVRLTVDKKPIENVSVAYADGKIAADITKVYDGTDSVTQQDALAYDSSDIVTFKVYDAEGNVTDNEKDNVKITATAAYDDEKVNATADTKTFTFDKYAKDGLYKDVDGVKTFFDDSANYEFAQTVNLTGDNAVNGNITKKTLTITMTHVPEIVKDTTDTEVTLENGDFTVSGLVSNDSSIVFTVKHTYADTSSITAVAGTAAMTGNGTWDVANAANKTTIDTNYDVTLVPTGGTVIGKTVESIRIITDPKQNYEHGDQFQFNDMLFEVVYDSANNDVWYYKYHQDADDPYDTDKNYWTKSATQDGTYTQTTLADNDLTIVWGTSASTSEVEQGTKLRLDSLPTGFSARGDKQQGILYVRTTNAVRPNDTSSITVDKKQLKLIVKGHAEKIYNGDALLQTDSTRTYTDGVTENFTFYFDGIDGSDTLAVNETASLTNNVVGYVTKTGNTERNQDAALKDIAVATANIVTTETDGSSAYYKLPSADEHVVNTATGEIKKRALKITGVADGAVSIKNDESQTGQLTGLLPYDSETNPYGYLSEGLYNSEQVAVNIGYTFAVDPATVSVTTTDAVVSYAEDATTPVVNPDDAPARNYDITFDLADGKGTITAETLTSIAVTTGPTKAQTETDAYEYKDQVKLAGTVITLTYDNNKTEVYTYDSTAGDGDKKWKYTDKDGEEASANVDLPSEITLSFDRTDGTEVKTNADPSAQNRVVMADNATHLKAVHSGITEPGVSAETYYVKKRVITVTTANKENTPYEKTYNKSNAVSAAEVTDKLDITNDLAAVLAAAGETGRFDLVAASDITATIGDANGNVKLKADNETIDDQQEIKLDQTAYSLPTVDAGGTPDASIAQQYELKYVDNAKGKINQKEIAVNIFAPSIEQDLTNTESKRTVSPTEVSQTASSSKGYFTAPLLEENDEITIQYTAKYDDPTKVSETNYDADLTITADTLKIDGGSAQNNYKITDAIIKGTVTSASSLTMTISKQPTKVQYKSGEKLDLTGMQVTIAGIDDPIDYDPDNADSEWNKLGLSIEPTDTQDGTTLSVGSNATDSIHVVRGTGENKETARGTVDITTAPRTIKVSADTISKIYDGKSDAPVTLKIAADQTGFDGFRTGTNDADNAAIAPAAMTDNFKYVDKTSGEDVVDASENAYKVVAKDANKIVLSDQTLAKEYELKVDELEGKINKRPLKIEILAPSKTVNSRATDADKALDLSGVTLTATNAKGKYSLATGSNSIIEGDTVTIAYKGAYTDISTQTNTGAAPVTVTEVSVDGTDKAPTNYSVEVTKSTGTVVAASTPSSGGGGGGSSNTLSIKYENEDGTAGADVSKIEAQVGDDPTDLIGVFRARMTNQTVLWTSSNEKVATVDENGIVTYVGEGKATITATSQQSKSLKDTVDIVVTAATATPTPEPTEAPDATPTPKPSYTKTDSLITKEMLNPYIVGYDDYVFGPELPISREELSAIFARLIQNSIYMDKDYDTSFPDVPEKWSKSYIGFLEGYNVVTGYEDGTFRPENYITRAEMAVMMAKAEGYDLTGYVGPDEVPFPDVDEGYSTWAATKAIKILTDMGIMQGYPDGTFRPGQPITRAETVATVNRVLADMEVADYEVLPSDVTDAHWAYNDIVFAMNHRILKDAAADPQRFIWSEQFDENMIINTERVEGETIEVPASEEAGDASEESSSEETAGSEDAIAPEATEKPAEDTAQTTN